MQCRFVAPPRKSCRLDCPGVEARGYSKLGANLPLVNQSLRCMPVIAASPAIGGDKVGAHGWVARSTFSDRFALPHTTQPRRRGPVRLPPILDEASRSFGASRPKALVRYPRGGEAPAGQWLCSRVGFLPLVVRTPTRQRASHWFSVAEASASCCLSSSFKRGLAQFSQAFLQAPSPILHP